MKVLEVDVVRKRISLSIKQAEEARQVAGTRNQKPVQGKQQPSKDLSNMAMTDALSELKKKFGR